jgi:hypothetical protein
LKGIAGGSLKRKPSQLADEFEMLLARLALFAPAIRGFAPSSWVGALLKVGRLAAYADPILHFSTAFVEMERTTLLNDLRDDTYKLSEACPWIAALKATILFGRNDHIVAKGEYLNDVIEEPIEDNQGHTSICKPTPSYRRPLYFAVGTHGDPKTRGAHSV